MGYHIVSSGERFLVDDEFDYLISGCKWQLLRDRTGRMTHYVRCKENKSKKPYLLHRLLVGALPGEQVDHINYDGMDNRLCNLRIVSRSENLKRCRVKHNSLTGFRGVSNAPWSKHRPYQVRLTFDGRRHFLGTYPSLKEAVEAYNAKALEVHGKFAHLNEVPK